MNPPLTVQTKRQKPCLVSRKKGRPDTLLSGSILHLSKIKIKLLFLIKLRSFELYFYAICFYVRAVRALISRGTDTAWIYCT
jgi:hypothetical protein